MLVLQPATDVNFDATFSWPAISYPLGPVFSVDPG